MPDWPTKPCKSCGREIRLVKTSSGWTPFETDRFEPHRCGKRQPKLIPGGAIETNRRKH